MYVSTSDVAERLGFLRLKMRSEIGQEQRAAGDITLILIRGQMTSKGGVQ